MKDFFRLKNSFVFDFYTRRRIYKYYNSVYNTTNNSELGNTNSIPRDYGGKEIVIVHNISPYFIPRISPDVNPYRYHKIRHLEGYMANLQGFRDLEAYMRSQFSSKSRSRIRRHLNRLEVCFEISYKMYFGEIPRAEYDVLFARMKEMIIMRFAQRGDDHEAINNWKFYQDSAYAMIRDKKASLFVICDSTKPIDICLNYHHENVFYNCIRSYDIDYSKFSPGYLDIYKQLEWCFLNGHSIFDLSHGNLDYKKQWCNTIYTFEQHILYNSKYPFRRFIAYGLKELLRLRWFLKKTGVFNLLKRIIARTEVQPETSSCMLKEELIEPGDLEKIKAFPRINIGMDQYAFLRKAVYDFQFVNSLNSGSVNVYAQRDTQNVFFVEGNDKLLKLTRQD